MTAPVAFVVRVMSVFFMTAAAEQSTTQSAPAKRRLVRLARPALGLLLPVAIAVFWEYAVWMGWSNGRLVPPPSVIFKTFFELSQTGELQSHAFATVTRVAFGFFFGVVAGTIAGAIAGWGLLDRRPWARTLAIVLGVLALFDIPFGTALGIYTLWVLATSGGEMEYRSIARPV